MKSENKLVKHIVIDNRIRRSSTGRYVDRLVEHLQKIDKTNKYTILITPDDDWQPGSTNFARVDCRFAQFSLNPMDQINFAKLLYQLKPDLVHFPMNTQPLLYFGKTVTTTMDFTMLRYTRPGKTPYPIFVIKMALYRFLFWYSNRKSKHIITISNYVKNQLEKTYSFTRNKVTNTYCASEPVLSGKAVRPKGLTDKTKFIMYCGTAFPHKNLENLILATNEIVKKDLYLKLVLVGKKEQYYDKIDKYIEKNNFDFVIPTGFIPDSELKWLYEHTQAYVFPSLSEGFGLPGLEAMVHGAPVVSSNATCLPEIYGDAALYFNPNDVEDMSHKIERVLEDKEYRKELIKRGHSQAKKYSWEKMAKETLEVYKKVLEIN